MNIRLHLRAVFVCSLWLLFFSSSLLAQQNTRPIHFKGGTFLPLRQQSLLEFSTKKFHDSLAPVSYKGHSYVMLTFGQLPGRDQQQQLEAMGVHLYSYLPDHSYLAEVKKGVLPADLKRFTVSGMYRQPGHFKLSPKMLPGGKMSAGEDNRSIGVSFFGSISRDEVAQALQKAGATLVATHLRPDHIIFIEAGAQVLQTIAALPYVGYIGPQSVRDRTLNYNNRATHGLDALGSISGRNLQGNGVTVGVGDNGDPSTHVDFTGRLINRYSDVSGTHGVHTAGTVGGAGILDQRFKGMAPYATIISQAFSDIIVNAQTYISDYDMVLTNNSYSAYDPGCITEGEYDFLSNYIDEVSLTYPSLLNNFASGNDGLLACAPFGPPYGTVKSGYQCGKNVLTVGNLYTGTNAIIYTSSSGPVNDGRIKPEIVAGGTNIVSTIPNNNYALMSGTSMSTPTVTGSLALLVERYRQLHGGMDPPAALIKTLACNSATDLGNPGPDFLYGFGSLNARAAVEALENNTWYTGSINNTGSDSYVLTGIPAGLQQIKIMLYWPDQPAAPDAATALVNNLDLTVTSPDASLHRPLILNPAAGHVNDNAVEGTDNVNNIEQVVINNPPGGSFTITVHGSGIPNGPQNYFVAWQAIPPSVILQYPFGDETWVPGDNEIIRWTAFGGEPNTFTLAFSPDNGSTWNTIDNAIPAASRLYSWTVPAAATNQARVRITRNVSGYSDTSDYPFTILGQPIVTTTNPCQGYAQMIWKTIPSATAYDIMQLKGDSMVKIASTTDTSYLLGNLKKDSGYWLCVRAVNNIAVGRRSLAANIIPSGGACALTVLDNDHTVDALLLPALAGRQFTSGALGSNTPISVEIKNLGTIAPATSFSMSYRLNGGSIVTETGSTGPAPNGVTTFTFTGTCDLSAVGTYNLQVWISYPGDPQNGNDTFQAVIRQLQNDPLTLNPVFADGFETAAAAAYVSPSMGFAGAERYDFRSNSSNGRARTFINTGFARTGNRCLTLDQIHNTPTLVTDSLIATYNLSNYGPSDQLWLNFYYRNQGIDFPGAGDRVWIRGNDQAAWIPVYDLDTSFAGIGIYQPAGNIDIRGMLAGASPVQTVSSSFQVKFGETGYTAANSVITDGNLDDGYSFDDITLTRSSNDAGVISLAAPVFSNICNLSNAETVSVKVRNYSAGPLTNIPISYAVNGVTVTESIPSINGYDSVLYTFNQHADLSSYQTYTLTAWISFPGDNYHFNDTLAPVHFLTSPLISSYPYHEGFESDDGHWYSGGINDSWEWGAPAKATINRAANGTKCWVTHLNGNYNDKELSYLYSPCFDLSGLSHPVLSFSHIFQTEDNCPCDYHWVEYTLDGGVHWLKLGAVGAGVNWYDNAMVQAWQASDEQWHVSSLDLPVNASRVRLRFVMSSDQATNYEGVGIDDIHIFEKASIYSGANISSGLSQPVSGGNWVDFDMGGHRVVSLNPNGQDLGTTNVKVFINGGPVRNDSAQYYLDRNIVIQPANPPTDPVSVRYYFLDSEIQRLESASGCPACSKLADAYQTGVTQYSSAVAAEEDSTLNNDISGTFRFFLPHQDVQILPYDNGYYAEYLVSGFSEFWINNGGPAGNQPLPINLLSFTVVKAGTAALLQWSTSLEENASRFIIEKGKDGVRFLAIDSLNAGTGGPVNNYKYTDADPGVGKTWYRLKMVDADGKFTYSPIRSISDTSGTLVINVYPNPIHSGNLNIVTSANCKRIMLTDVSGRTILQMNARGFFNVLSLTGIAPGIYFATIDTDAGSSVQKVFVK